MAYYDPYEKSWWERFRRWTLSNTTRHATSVAIAVVAIILFVLVVLYLGFSTPEWMLLRNL